MRLLRLFNRQKIRPVDAGLWRRIARCLLEELLQHEEYELAVHLIDSGEMATLNEKFLSHAGSTDVLSFDYRDGRNEDTLQGEIFISVPDAITQSAQFRTSWQSEIVRYLAHGLLHLEGHDDTSPALRRKMKQAENKLVKELSRRFDFGRLGRRKHASGGK